MPCRRWPLRPGRLPARDTRGAAAAPRHRDQLDDGTDYVIDEDAAERLARKRGKPVLVRLADRAKVPVARTQAVKAIADGDVFEQLNT